MSFRRITEAMIMAWPPREVMGSGDVSIVEDKVEGALVYTTVI